MALAAKTGAGTIAGTNPKEVASLFGMPRKRRKSAARLDKRVHHNWRKVLPSDERRFEDWGNDSKYINGLQRQSAKIYTSRLRKPANAALFAARALGGFGDRRQPHHLEGFLSSFEGRRQLHSPGCISWRVPLLSPAAFAPTAALLLHIPRRQFLLFYIEYAVTPARMAL